MAPETISLLDHRMYVVRLHQGMCDCVWAQHVFDSYDEICSALTLLTKHIPDPSDTFHGKKHHLSLFSLSVSYAAVWASGRMIGSRSYQMTRATGPRPAMWPLLTRSA